MKQLFLLLTFFSLTIIVTSTGAKWTFGVGLNLGSSIGFGNGFPPGTQLLEAILAK
jgi:hypothetical protein